MIEQVLNIGVGLVLGLATGFYFERRATRAAREHATQLEAELAHMRRSVYGMGGSVRTDTGATTTATTADLVSLLHQRALVTQDAGGKVRRSNVTSHFLAEGHPRDDIEAAIAQLIARGDLTNDGTWLVVR